MIRESSRKGYDHYRRKRLSQLQNLAWLFFTGKYQDRLYLVGEVSLTVPCPGAGRDGVEFLERYTISPDQILHQTATSIVLAGTDKRSDHAPVALKFMRSQLDYLAEATSPARNATPASRLHIVAKVESERISGGRITKEDVEPLKGSAVERICSDMNLCGMYLVILERGSVDLAHEVSCKAHIDHAELVEIAKDIAGALQYMNETAYVAHGDVKLRNFVKTRNMDGTSRWKAIDLDGSSRHADPIGAKLSTACCPPEMARLKYRYLYGDHKNPTYLARSAADHSQPSSSDPVEPQSTGVRVSRKNGEPLREDFEWPVGTEAAMMPSNSAGPGALTLSMKSQSNDRLVPTVSYSNNPEDQHSSASRQQRWVEWLKEQDEVHANVTYDIWSFGVLLYSLFVPGATSMFLSSANDEIVNQSDLYILAYEWEFHKLAMVENIEHSVARDLVLWCLQSDPTRRPSNFTEILRHPLFQVPALSPRSETRLRSCSSASARVNSVLPEPEPEPGPEPEPEPELGPHPIARSETMKRRLATTFQGETPLADDEDSALMRHQSSVESETTQRLLHYCEPIAERAYRLHRAIEVGDMLSVKQLFNQGGVHANLTLQLQERMDDAKEPLVAPNRVHIYQRNRSLLPVHRAARLGHVEIVQFLCSEVQRKHMVLDKQIDNYWYTALHVAAAYARQDMVELLISEGCDTSVKTYRGKTAWDIAIENGHREVCAVFERWAAANDDGYHVALHTERKSRYLRPNIKEAPHEDLELDFDRCGFWGLRQFDSWQELSPDLQSPFMYVYHVPDVFPPIQQRGQLFDKAAIKVAQDPRTQQRLRAIVGKLASITHQNVCHVLGIIEGSTPHAPKDCSWMFAWEVCKTSLSSLLDGANDMCSHHLILDLTKQIAGGMEAIHEQDILHLDLNGSNVLLTTGLQGQWVAKVANFGLLVPDATAWVGSPMYMAPECCGTNETITPDKSADVFSFAILCWEMFTRQTVRSQFADLEFPRVWVPADGKEGRDAHLPTGQPRRQETGQWREDMRVIAKAYCDARRPIIPATMSKMIRLLLEACWDARPAHRPEFGLITKLLLDVEDSIWLQSSSPEDEPDSDSAENEVDKKSEMLRREAARVSASYRWKELKGAFTRTRSTLTDANPGSSAIQDTAMQNALADSVTSTSEADIVLAHDHTITRSQPRTNTTQEELLRTQSALEASRRNTVTHAAVARKVAAAGYQAVGAVRRYELLQQQQQTDAADITTQALAVMQRASQVELRLEQHNAQLEAELQLARATLALERAQTKVLVDPEQTQQRLEPECKTATEMRTKEATRPSVSVSVSKPRAVVSMDSLLTSHRALATPPSSTLTSVRDAFDPLAFLSLSEDEEVDETEVDTENVGNAHVELKAEVHEGVPPDVLSMRPKERATEPHSETESQPDLFKTAVAVLAAALEVDQQVLQGDSSGRPRALKLYSEGLQLVEKVLDAGGYSAAVEGILRQRALDVEARLEDLAKADAEQPEPELESEPQQELDSQLIDDATDPHATSGRSHPSTLPVEPEPEDSCTTSGVALGADLPEAESEQQVEELAAELKAEADQMMDYEKYSSAAETYGKAAALDSGNAALLKLQADALAKQRAHELQAVGEHQIETEDYAAAVGTFDEALEYDPRSADISELRDECSHIVNALQLNAQAEAEMATGEYEKAVESYLTALNEDPGNMDAAKGG